MKYKVSYIKDGKVKHTILSANSTKEISVLGDILNIQQQKQYEFKFYHNKNCDMLFRELEIILTSSLPLSQAIHLLIQNTNNEYHKEILQDIKNSINSGQNIDFGLEKHTKNIGILPILFLKIGYLSGDMKGALHNLNLIINLKNKTKKQLLDAIRYPLVVSVFLIIAMVMIFSYVIPQFEALYSEFNSKLPFMTTLLLGLKNILSNYGIFLVAIVGVLFFLVVRFYKSSLVFKLKIDKMLFYKIPLISSVISLWQIHQVFLTLSSLLEVKYSFIHSLQNTQLIATNTFVASQLKMIEEHIQSGDTISKAFASSAIFDDLSNSLLFSGEVSNTLPSITKELQAIYYMKLEEKIKFFSSIIEPVLLVFVALFIVWLILALMLPIWEMGNIIR